MNKILFLFVVYLSLVVWSEAATTVKPQYHINEAERLFEEFLQNYNKHYESEEEKLMRFEIFKKRLEEINEKNLDENETAVFGISFHTDLTEEEFRRGFFGHVSRGDTIFGTNCSEEFFFKSNKFTAPDEFDWRDKGVITPVKDQNPCGSCWAFSAVANIESKYAMKHNKTVLFSEQQLVSCDETNDGCDGGWSHIAFAYVLENGLMTEEDYPYEAQDSACRVKPDKYAVKLSACTFYKLKDEEALKELLVTKGPLSFYACSMEWHDYKGGILSKCCSDINHAILLVGYGTENGTPYWIVKNSWGKEYFGEDGYIRLLRGSNTCGMMDEGFATVTVK